MASDPVEGNSQIQADGSGDKVRTLEFEVLQPNGTRATVVMQVMAMADNSGTLIGDKYNPVYVDSQRLGEAVHELTEEVRRLTQLMAYIHGVEEY